MDWRKVKFVVGVIAKAMQFVLICVLASVRQRCWSKILSIHKRLKQEFFYFVQTFLIADNVNGLYGVEVHSRKSL